MSNREPDVFVIMPFDAELKAVFDLIKGVLEKECGHKVTRADESVNQQNILKDIVHHIYTSKIIIADLTGQNPNVFYELALAHAFNKKVILLAQDINEVPFDLRPYRIIIYSTHFSQIEYLTSTLKQIMTEIDQGTMSFGNPVSDWLPRSEQDHIVQPTTLLQQGEKNDAAGEPEEDGIVDYLADVKESSERLSVLVKEWESNTERLSETLNQATRKMQLMQSVAPKDIDAVSLRKVLRDGASGLNEYGSFLTTFNRGFSSSWDTFERGLLRLTRDHVIPARDSESYNSYVAVLNHLREQMGRARGSITLLHSETEKLKTLRLQKDVTRACGIVQQELKIFLNFLDKSIATMDTLL